MKHACPKAPAEQKIMYECNQCGTILKSHSGIRKHVTKTCPIQCNNNRNAYNKICNPTSKVKKGGKQSKVSLELPTTIANIVKNYQEEQSALLVHQTIQSIIKTVQNEQIE